MVKKVATDRRSLSPCPAHSAQLRQLESIGLNPFERQVSVHASTFPVSMYPLRSAGKSRGRNLPQNGHRKSVNSMNGNFGVFLVDLFIVNLRTTFCGAAETPLLGGLRTGS